MDIDDILGYIIGALAFICLCLIIALTGATPQKMEREDCFYYNKAIYCKIDNKDEN